MTEPRDDVADYLDQLAASVRSTQERLTRLENESFAQLLAGGADPRTGAFGAVDLTGAVAGDGSVYPPPVLGDGTVTTDTIAPGAITPITLDTTPPADPTSVVASSDTIRVNDEEVVRLIVSLTQPADTDLNGTWVYATRNEVSEGVPDWTLGLATFIPKGNTQGTFEGVAANQPYYVRAISVDVQGNVSSYVNASAFPFTTSVDSSAPAVPIIISSASGFNAIGLLWGSVGVPDLRFYQVRYSTDAGSTWSQPVNVSATTFVFTGLDPALTYSLGVRAVDTSGNVNDGTAIGVNFETFPDTGYATVAGLNPGQVTGADIATGTILANNIAAGAITTDKLTGNTITVKPTGSYARGFQVLNSSGVEIGLWNDDGLTIRDPSDPTNRFIRLSSGALRLYVDGVTASSAITPDGIDASKITFGSAQGGHNLIKNSSFELSANTGATNNVTHTITADFTGAQTSATNTSTSGDKLSVTAF